MHPAKNIIIRFYAAELNLRLLNCVDVCVLCCCQAVLS